MNVLHHRRPQEAANQARRHFAALARAERFRLVWIGNIGCEPFWTSPAALTLPRLASGDDGRIARCLDEMALCLASSDDVIVLRTAPDPDYLDYLRSLGLSIPSILVVPASDPRASISSALLESPAAMASLTAMARSEFPTFLQPFGCTALEEELSRETGLPLLWPSAALCAQLNSKIFGRRLSRDLGLRTVPGYECETLEDVRSSYTRLSRSASGPVVLKEAMGFSGKGLQVIANQHRFEQLMRLMERRVESFPEVALVLEQWLDRSLDVNYQILITPGGDVTVMSIKESITANGVHAGHRQPPPLTAEQRQSLMDAGTAIGQRLSGLGFFGIVGIDAIVDSAGVIYPLLELNARLNMSTYELALDRFVGCDQFADYTSYSFRLAARVTFAELATYLRPYLLEPGIRRAGVMVHCFSTLNANVEAGRGRWVRGRVHCLLVGRSPAHVHAIGQEVYAALTAPGSPLHPRLDGPAGSAGC